MKQDYKKQGYHAIVVGTLLLMTAVNAVASDVNPQEVQKENDALIAESIMKNIKESRALLPVMIEGGTLWDGIDAEGKNVNYLYKLDIGQLSPLEKLVAFNGARVMTPMLCFDGATKAGYRNIYRYRDSTDKEIINFVIDTESCKKILNQPAVINPPTSSSLGYKLNLAYNDIGPESYTTKIQAHISQLEKEDRLNNQKVTFPDSFLEVAPASKALIERAVVK